MESPTRLSQSRFFRFGRLRYSKRDQSNYLINHSWSFCSFHDNLCSFSFLENNITHMHTIVNTWSSSKASRKSTSGYSNHSFTTHPLETVDQNCPSESNYAGSEIIYQQLNHRSASMVWTLFQVYSTCSIFCTSDNDLAWRILYHRSEHVADCRGSIELFSSKKKNEKQHPVIIL